ncbi:hypothetical protein [Aliarcobacter butzleri]|uniref:Uncharacterized protein n=1 Tax=Aliarcobacter butzleri TaxID=28197 RepID=A0AAW7PPL5_9BACT|nr:hypothetical protein [Aliarcobacter butzleri]MCT7620620.1 hypothetical protein [Aliarcobacter butzleri]MDN5063280.1 hypothetical protein [Aliarcobacter butzleri]MDN5065924.1 hypothetical protein [Aliarcobacter butzleri]MDN5073844.1 hypothetical protein [Aliarcobacter butzleri]MDN5081092.1 hypothetical protein [Aliarcobacter butzleri]
MKNSIKISSAPFAGAPYIQNYRYLVKDNKNTKEEAINKAKDNR